ncbi:MAG: glycosyltransferase family 4 protein [Rhodospirillales bacterium]|nr:glycosyltransferase family 4 protein [Rhodospirillales bacterium]
MKVLEITNVDFALRQFILPLLRGIRERGHEVVGVSADGPLLAQVRAEGIRVETVPMSRSLSPAAQLRAFLALLALMRREKPDLVHAHMPISGFLARIAAWIAGVPRIAYTCHGYLFNQPGPWWRRHLAIALEWIAGRVTDVYFNVSAAEAQDARRLHLARAPVAIGNGRDPERFRPDPQARERIRAELQTPPGRPVVVIVSRLVRAKGIPELLAAMADVDAELWVVGERLASDHDDSVEPDFAACQLGPRLKRLGYREDIPAILAAADIFALPSHFEGLPMSIVEAMLVGMPVVASDLRGVREQVVDGETGYLVPIRSVAPLRAALARLATNHALCRAMGEAGRIRAMERFDERKILARTLDLLRL